MDSNQVKNIAIKSLLLLSLIGLILFILYISVSIETLQFIASGVGITAVIILVLGFIIGLYKTLELSLKIPYLQTILNRFIKKDNEIKQIPQVYGFNLLILEIMIITLIVIITTNKENLIKYTIPQVIIQWILSIISYQYTCNWVPFTIQYLLLSISLLFDNTAIITIILQSISVIICTRYCIKEKTNYNDIEHTKEQTIMDEC